MAFFQVRVTTEHSDWLVTMHRMVISMLALPAPHSYVRGTFNGLTFYYILAQPHTAF